MHCSQEVDASAQRSALRPQTDVSRHLDAQFGEPVCFGRHQIVGHLVATDRLDSDEAGTSLVLAKTVMSLHGFVKMRGVPNLIAKERTSLYVSAPAHQASPMNRQYLEHCDKSLPTTAHL